MSEETNQPIEEEKKDSPAEKTAAASEEKQESQDNGRVEETKSAGAAGDSSDATEEGSGEETDRRRRRPARRTRKPSARKSEEPASDFLEKVLAIKRVTKVTKGGKKLSFSALVVVGDTKGRVGYSLSKAGEVATAIRKALATAKKNMVAVPLEGTTIPHEIIGVCGGAEVLLKPAGEGTGVIASGPVRAVCDGAGIHNILTKCHRSNNPINVVKATFNGLGRLKTAPQQAEEPA